MNLHIQCPLLKYPSKIHVTELLVFPAMYKIQVCKLHSTQPNHILRIITILIQHNASVRSIVVLHRRLCVHHYSICTEKLFTVDANAIMNWNCLLKRKDTAQLILLITKLLTNMLTQFFTNFIQKSIHLIDLFLPILIHPRTFLAPGQTLSFLSKFCTFTTMSYTTKGTIYATAMCIIKA